MKTLILNQNQLNKINYKKYLYISVISFVVFVFFIHIEYAKADILTEQSTQNNNSVTTIKNADVTILTSATTTVSTTTSESIDFVLAIKNTASSTSPLLDINKINVPEIIAKNAVVYDVTNKEFIYAKNADEPVPMASLAKVLTAEVFLQLDNERQKRVDQVDTIKIIKNGIGYNQGDRDLINGELWKKNNLIRYMLITSSNFAAQSLANSIVDDEFSFALLMNKSVKDSGFNSFSFKNSSGLSIASPNSNLEKIEGATASSTLHKQTPSAIGNAREIAILFNSIFTNIPFLGEASILPEATFLNWSGNTHDTKNVNESLSQIPHIIAGKTGTTEESGGNLMIIVEIEHKKYAIVILGSTIEDRYLDAHKIASSTEAFALLNK